MKIDNLFWELLNNIWLFSYFLVISAFFLLKPFPLFWKAWLDRLQLIRASRARRISPLMQANKLSQIIFLKSTGCVFLFFVFFFFIVFVKQMLFHSNCISLHRFTTWRQKFIIDDKWSATYNWFQVPQVHCLVLNLGHSFTIDRGDRTYTFIKTEINCKHVIFHQTCLTDKKMF